MARLELAIAAIAVLTLPILWVASPDTLALPMAGRVNLPILAFIPVLAEIAMLVGFTWMVRIWRGPTRESPPAWRYRDGD
jgi:hypothetical protein